jgi:solute:Na+ symporter, SSS family
LNLAIGNIDLGIIAAYTIAVVLFGLWIGRNQKDVSSYLLGNRNLPWWAILGSIVATETSTATFLSVPGIAFAVDGDLRFLQLVIGFLCGRFLVAYILIPQFFKGQIFSAYEILDKRFGKATKQTASTVFLVTRNLGDGLRLFLTGIVLEKVCGCDLATSIAIIGIATIIYTFFGGMKAVVWNDCIQFVVYIGGGITAGIIMVQLLPGGWSEMVTYAQTNNKLQMFDFSWDVTETFTFWAGVIGGTVLSLGTHGTDQMMVQRYLSGRGICDAQRAVIASGFVIFAQFALFLFLGIGLAAFYSQLTPAQSFERPDEVFATFIIQQMPIGLIGITLAAVFSAAMSTLSSSLSASASAVVNDIYLPAKKSKPTDKQLLKVSRWTTVAFGLLQICLGIAASYVSRSVVEDALAIAGFAAGILLGIFGLGVYTKRVTQIHALIGLLSGVVCLTSIKFATNIAWPWFAIIGAMITFTTGLLTSYLIKSTNSSKPNPRQPDY